MNVFEIFIVFKHVLWPQPTGRRFITICKCNRNLMNPKMGACVCIAARCVPRKMPVKIKINWLSFKCTSNADGATTRSDQLTRSARNKIFKIFIAAQRIHQSNERRRTHARTHHHCLITTNWNCSTVVTFIETCHCSDVVVVRCWIFRISN